MAKIFCIGLNKTGSTSLHQAFGQLGFRSLHWAPENRDWRIRKRTADRIADNIRHFKDHDVPLLTLIEDYDVYSDIGPLAASYQLLDKQYPGSKFILNTRSNVDAWIESRRKHFAKVSRLAVETDDLPPNWSVEEDRWRKYWFDHHASVTEYFEDRPDDFLIIDVPGGDEYDVLCPFLGVGIPSTPFPKRNISA
ncbi:MAG: sulfotransferase [Pseudomonadota bacterium]